MPQGRAQQPDAQSLAFRHWPPMNCTPRPLPTFFSPAGSNLGPPTQASLASPPVRSGPLSWESVSHPATPVTPARTMRAPRRRNLLENMTIRASRCIEDPLSECSRTGNHLLTTTDPPPTFHHLSYRSRRLLDRFTP